MKINGNLSFAVLGSGELQNAIIERVASATSQTGAAGRLVYDTTLNAYFYHNGTSWIQFAAGTTSVASFSAGTTGLTPSSATTGAITLGGTLIAANGGTGFNTYTIGDLLYADSTSTLAKLGIGASGTVLHGGTNPSYGAVDLTVDVSGVLPIANGGTNGATAVAGFDNLSPLTTKGDVIVYSGTHNVRLGVGANNTALVANTGATNGVNWAAIVNSIAGTANEITASAATGAVTLSIPSTFIAPGSVEVTTSLTVDSLTASGAVYADASKVLQSVALTNGQLLVGSTGADPVATTLTAGTGVSVTNGAGSITVANTGVLTFAVSTTSSGVTVTPTSATAGAVSATVDINTLLQAFSQLPGNGFVVQTAAGTVTNRSISGTAGNITVTNGDGVTASPTINLATVTQGSSGTSFVKVALDGFGRVIDNTAVTTGDITALVDSQYLRLDGTTTPTANIGFGGFKVTSVGTPTTGTDATNKNYVDALVVGLEWKAAAQAATTATLTATYANGTAGVGATLTNSGTQAAFAVDGYTAVLNDRILVKDQTAQLQNGIYTVTTLGSGATNWILTRATDADTSAEVNNATLFVTNGTVNKDTGWTQTFANPAIGTDTVVFQQFTGAGTYVAGTGLTLTGNTFSVNLGAGIEELPTGDVGIDLFNTTTGALILTTTGTNRSTAANSQLQLLTPANVALTGGGGLVQDATGLYIPSAGVLNPQLENPTLTLDVTGGGTGALALGGTFLLLGNSSQGVSTSISGGAVSGGYQTTNPTVTVTVADAGTTSSNKGVAWFDPAYFTATTGKISWNTAANLEVASLIDDGLTAKGAVYADATKTLQSVALTNGQLLIGSTGNNPVAAAIVTSGAGISVTNGAGSITLANTGVTSFQTSLSGLTPSTSTTGAITLAGTLGATSGGTGFSTYTAGDLLYASSGTALSKLAAGTANQVLHGGTTPSWSAVDLTADVSGILPSANGGTGVANGSGAVGTALIATATGQFTATSIQKTFSSAVADGGAGPATTFVCTHSLGQRFVNVTVYDSTFNQIIPQSVVLTSTTAVTVTVNSAIDAYVVVMGVAGVGLSNPT